MTAPLTPEREPPERILERLDGLIGEADTLSAKSFAVRALTVLFDASQAMADLLATLDAERARAEAAEAALRLAEEELRLREESQIPVIPRAAHTRLQAAEAALAEIGKFAASHSGRDGQPVLLAARYRIAEECKAAAAASTGEEDVDMAPLPDGAIEPQGRQQPNAAPSGSSSTVETDLAAPEAKE